VAALAARFAPTAEVSKNGFFRHVFRRESVSDFSAKRGKTVRGI
jgi:hypothetical protein